MIDTPAYWALRSLVEENPLHGFTSSTGSLVEEIGFCILGGFGITAEVNDAAFKALRAAGVFDLSATVAEEDIKRLLLRPVNVQGRLQRYRFPNQRASRLTVMRQLLRSADLDSMPVPSLNQALRKIPGIGPKTAAWIIRNHFGSDDVAILDIHVIRACSRLRLFPADPMLPRDYEHLQEAFISFARAIQVRPAILDAVMWTEMRNEPLTYRRLAA
jgi:thermostable 8-oxoguanine DNA glycosylase